MKFNINSQVKVRLTPVGRAFHAAQFAMHKAMLGHNLDYRAPVEDAEGWSSWQLWNLMNEFGSRMSLGDAPPFETEIEIPNAAK